MGEWVRTHQGIECAQQGGTDRSLIPQLKRKHWIKKLGGW